MISVGTAQSKMLAVATAAMLPLGLGLGLAGPAEAATTMYGCTVTAKKPDVRPDLSPSGRKQVNYRWTIICDKERRVQIRQQVMEYDDYKIGDGGGKDDRAYETYSPPLRVAPANTLTHWNYYYELKDLDNYNVEETYHVIQFKVCRIDDGKACYTGWSQGEKSPYLSVHYA